MNKAYIFAAHAESPQALVGVIESDGNTGSFSYSDSWLNHPLAYPLDPVNLPLSNKRFLTANTKGLHGVFSDAGPDDWGTRILLMHNTHLPANELERLLRTSGNGVGCLAFSLSRTRPLSPKPLPPLSRVEELEDVVERVQGDAPLSEEELLLIDPGSSMGGARPKITCVDEQRRTWLLKFSRQGDPVDIPSLEYASMTFLQDRLGIQTPECRRLVLGSGKTAFMIKRFDRGCHFISAHSLFNQDRIRLIQDSRRNPYSYINLAKILRQHAHVFEHDLHELFRRMLANILLGNTDDHARNHAMLFNLSEQTWSLSPAYDVLPSLSGIQGKQALGIGAQGAESTIENALSFCQFFGIKTPQAVHIAEEMQSNIHQFWREHLYTCGLDERSVAIVMKHCRAKR